jgi:hypothetical protein
MPAKLFVSVRPKNVFQNGIRIAVFMMQNPENRKIETGGGFL